MLGLGKQQEAELRETVLSIMLGLGGNYPQVALSTDFLAPKE